MRASYQVLGSHSSKCKIGYVGVSSGQAVAGMMKTEVVPGRSLAKLCTHRLAAYDPWRLLQALGLSSPAHSSDCRDSVADVLSPFPACRGIIGC